jgi:pimeloyl-ACP methyl ester carboxylesterase
MVDDLHRLITFSSQQPRPLLLVGAEMGSLVSRFYSQMYEGDVTDVVLIDALTDDLFTHQQNIYSQFWTQHLIPSFQAMQLAAAVGLARLALLIGWLDQPMSNAAIELPIDVVRRQKHLLCNPRHLSSVVDEHFFINESFSQMKTALMMKSFPSNVSVTVINGNYYDDQLPSEINKAWASSQKNIITKVHPGAAHVIVNGADRHMLYRRPDAIIEPIKRLVRKWRTKQNLA